MEIWKDIKDYEGIYQISNLGNVKSFKWGKERILNLTLNGRNYFQLYLNKNGKSKMFKVHRLVYENFIGELINGLDVDHIDGNTKNNNVENLQQISHRENTVKGERTKNRSSNFVGVCFFKRTNKWKTSIFSEGKLKHLGYFHTEEEASAAYQAELFKINF